MKDLERLNFDKLGGILPAIIQDAATKEVLMLGFMNKEALRETLRRGQAVFWSRSRHRLWRKGEESGNVLEVLSIRADCDDDTLLIAVKPAGPVCHTGAYSCFEAPDTR
jgi:phosphoribosyl-ATP pyrophosphohydrolase/phosphoribosyl-AMP cyclohydrolase